MKTYLAAALRVVMIALLLSLSLYMGGCFDSPGIEPGTGTRPPAGPTPTRDALVRRVERPLWYEAVGTVEPLREVTVAPLVPGQLIEMRVEAGQRVELGTLLARLDGRELSARLGQARSSSRAAAAIAQQARAHQQRVVGLHEQHAATLEELEQAESGLARAEAELAAAEQRVLESEVSAGYARVESPMAGIVTERLADPGDVVWPGRPLYSIHDPSHLRLEAYVREAWISKVELGARLEVELGSEREVLEATIDEIMPTADPVSRSFLVKASLPTRAGLYSGMFGRLRVPIGSRAELLAPSAAIASVGQLRLCRVETPSGWQRRHVTLGERMGADVVVLSGLAEGERLGWE